MSSTVPIENVPPYIQIIATSLQTVFDTNFTADDDADVVVYARADGVEPDDVTQLVDPANYTVSYVGVDEIVRVTFTVGRTLDDIVTIMRMTPVERLNLYTNTNFTTSMLNGDFGKQTMMIQEREYCDDRLAPKYNNNATVIDVVDTILPILGAGQGWRKNDDDDAIEVIDIPDGSLAPGDAKYLIQTADGDLPNAQAMGALANGIVINTTITGVQLTRTLTGTASEIDVENGTGIAGNPTVGISDNPVIPGTEGMGIPQGTTAERPGSPSGTELRYNTDLQAIEYWSGTAWVQLDDADLSQYLLLAGGTMTGDINMGTNKVTNADDPTDPQDYATKAYVDGGGGSPPFLPLAGGTMAGDISLDDGFRVTNALDPLAPQDYATRNYVDQTALIGASVYAATIDTSMNATQAGAGVGATLTDASGTFAPLDLDSVAIPLNSDVLVKNTGTGVAAANEGIYKLTTNGDGISIPWQLTRSVEYDTPEQINNTGLIIVQNGSTLAGTVWYNTATIVTVDTTAFSYTQFGGNFALKGANSDITSLTGITGVIQAPTFINDSAGLPVLGFGSVATAVNYVTITNNSTGNAALIDATGSDGTVDLNLRAKGNIFRFSSNNATGDATLKLYLANGTDFVGLKAPTATATTPTFTLPAVDGSANFIMKTNGSAILSLTNGSQIAGTATNDNASAGNIGEFVSVNVPLASSITLTSSATDYNVTSIPLTAGDWDVWGNAIFTAGTVDTIHNSWTSTTSATVPDSSLVTREVLAFGSGSVEGSPVPFLRVSTAGATTVYLSVRATFSGTSPKACGNIFARRVR